MADENLSCSWCQRSKDDVKHLLAGPGIAVCDECLGELSAILAEENSDWRDAQIERLSKLGQPKK
jgi:ATP-dependent Clp protease ATP-binding subunit ClpX